METRERGGCLTAWLAFVLIVNVFSGAYYLFSSSMIQETMPSFPDWAIPVTGVIAVVNFVFMLAIWYWKKWGMYGAVLSAVLMAFINFSAGFGVLGALSGFVGIAILAFLLRNVWEYME